MLRSPGFRKLHPGYLLPKLAQETGPEKLNTSQSFVGMILELGLIVSWRELYVWYA
jgi:hypothetical protein